MMKPEIKVVGKNPKIISKTLPDDLSENVQYVDEDVEVTFDDGRYILEAGDMITIHSGSTCEECGKNVPREDAHGWWVEESDQWESVYICPECQQKPEAQESMKESELEAADDPTIRIYKIK